MKVPFVRNPYNYDMLVASTESGLKCEDVSRTVQSSAEECDINTIVRRFGLTGQLPENVQVPLSGDFTEVVDFQSAMNLVIAAEAGFARMPAEVRKRFDNDPALFLAFVDDDKNRKEAESLGIVLPKPVPAVPDPLRIHPEDLKALRAPAV